MASALGPRGSSRAWRRLRERWAAALPLPCSVCGEPVAPGMRWHLDHVRPRKHGGQDAGNVWPAHATCNASKGAGEPPPARYSAPGWGQL